MKKLIASLVAIASLMQFACQTRIHHTLRLAESQMNTRPDSALAVLNGLDPGLLRSRAQRARYALLRSQALDKNYIDLASDSVIAPAVDYYSEHGSARDRAYTNYYLGCVRNSAGQIEKAVQAMVSAENSASEIGDAYLLARICSSLGCMYLDQHSLYEADSVFVKAEHYYRIEGDTLNLAYVLMNKAKVYSLLKRRDQSQRDYGKALDIFRFLGDERMVFLVTRSLVHEMVLGGFESTDSMKRLLVDVYNPITAGKVPSEDYSMWTWIYLKENKLDSARYFGERALSNGFKSANQKCGMILWMCQIESQAGNYRRANEYWKEYYKLFDSIVVSEKEQLIQQAEKRYKNQELVYANNLLRIRNRYTSLVWGIVLLGCLTVLIRGYVRRVRRYRQFIETLHDNYDLFRDRCRRLSEELDRSSDEEANLLGALERLLGRFQHLLEKGYDATNAQNLIREFKQYAKTIGTDKVIFSDLQFVVNKQYFGLVDHLREIHPNLTDYEMDMLCMLQLDFSFNCIRLLHQHENIYSLYSRRTKIHRKLGLASGYRLEDYLSELVARLKAGTQKATDSSAEV